MSHFIGNAGDTPKEKAIKQRLNVLIAIYLAMAAGFFLLGYATSKWSFWWSLATILILVPTAKFLERRWDRHLHFAHCHETGATGEREIIPFLKNLPDTYTVICNLDFADSYGDIDHLVIGPTGIFSIDVKNWKGTVAADGAGELLLERFLDGIKISNFDAESARVTTEENADGHGRFDIVLRDKNHRAIYIENKIHADLQDKQLTRYHEHNTEATLLLPI